MSWPYSRPALARSFVGSDQMRRASGVNEDLDVGMLLHDSTGRAARGRGGYA